MAKQKKSIKLSFEEVNKGQYRYIDAADLSSTNEKVKDEMKAVIREYDKNETRSRQGAAMLVLNS